MGAELGDVRLPDQDRPGLPQAGDRGRVAGRHLDGSQARRLARGQARRRDRLLDRERHSRERPGPRIGSRLTGPVEIENHDRVQLGVPLLDPFGVQVEHLDRADLPAADRRGDLGYLHVNPPSTGSAIPVTYLAAGEASQSTASLTSRTSSASRPGKTVEAPQRRPDLLEVRGAHLHQVVEHRGVDDGRADRVHGHVERRELESERASEPDDAVLGRLVRGLVRDADERRGRRDGDDSAAAFAARHVPRRVLRTEERSFEVRVDCGVPLLLGELRDRCAGIDAGVVDEDVEPAVALDRLDDEGRDLVLVADIRRDRVGLRRRPPGSLRRSRPGQANPPSRSRVRRRGPPRRSRRRRRRTPRTGGRGRGPSRGRLPSRGRPRR